MIVLTELFQMKINNVSTAFTVFIRKYIKADKNVS